MQIRSRWFTAAGDCHPGLEPSWAVTGILAGALAWLAHGSAGIGRLTDVGPEFLTMALWVAVEVAVGVVAGSVAGPWLENQPDPLQLHVDAE